MRKKLDLELSSLKAYLVHIFPGLCEVSPFGSTLVFPGHICGSIQIVVCI